MSQPELLQVSYLAAMKDGFLVAQKPWHTHPPITMATRKMDGQLSSGHEDYLDERSHAWQKNDG